MYARRQRTHAEEYLRLAASLGGVCILSALALFAMRGTWDMYGKLREASASAAAMKSELASFEVREERLTADIERLSTDAGVEGELRERYGFARPGEGVIRVVDRTPESASVEQVQGGGSAVFRALFSW